MSEQHPETDETEQDSPIDDRLVDGSDTDEIEEAESR